MGALRAEAKTAQTILVLGDSLSAEYGLPRGSGWAHLLEEKLAHESISARVINSSISGETTSGGLARLPSLMVEHKPTILVIELGANDALRGLAMRGTEKNLSQMIAQGQKNGAKVLLLGMQVPPNFGPAYTKEFSEVFVRTSKMQHSALVPFFLKGVADAPNANDLFQADGIHPIAKAHPTLLANVWPELKKLLQ